MASEIEHGIFVIDRLLPVSLVPCPITVHEDNMFPIMEIVFFIWNKWPIIKYFFLSKVIWASPLNFRAIIATINDSITVKVVAPSSTIKVNINFGRVSSTGNVIVRRGTIETEGGGSFEAYQVKPFLCLVIFVWMILLRFLIRVSLTLWIWDIKA